MPKATPSRIVLAALTSGRYRTALPWAENDDPIIRRPPEFSPPFHPTGDTVGSDEAAMDAAPYFSAARIAIRATAVGALASWVLSWLAPAVWSKEPPAHTALSALCLRLAHSRSHLLRACLLIMLAHMVAVFFATGFPAQLVSAALAETWAVPPGDVLTYSFVVGVPSAALVSLVLAVVGDLGDSQLRCPTGGEHRGPIGPDLGPACLSRRANRGPVDTSRSR